MCAVDVLVCDHKARAGHQTPSLVTLYLVPLRQSLSLNIQLGKLPAEPPVSARQSLGSYF